MTANCLLSQIDETIQKAQDRLLALLEQLEAFPDCKQSDAAQRAVEEACEHLEALKEKMEQVCEYRNEMFAICERTPQVLEKSWLEKYREHPDPYGLRGIEHVPDASPSELTKAAIEGIREIQTILKGEI